MPQPFERTDTTQTMRNVGPRERQLGPNREINRMQPVDLEVQALSIGLKNQSQEIGLLREQMERLCDAVPLGVIIFNQTGEIVRINQLAHSILGLTTDSLTALNTLHDVWRKVDWPSVPFSNLRWQGGVLRCWDEVLGQPGAAVCQTVRFIEVDPQDENRLDNAEGSRLARMSQMIGTISHELRNMFTSIELFSSLLQRHGRGHVEHEQVSENLISAIHTLEQYVNNMLLYVKPPRPHINKVHVPSLLKQVEVKMAQQLKKHQCRITQEIGQGVEWICADYSMLQQACVNLISNAMKTSSPGDCIELECRRHSLKVKENRCEVETFVEITVRDQGYGIHEEDVSQVSIPFYSTRERGAGLGLTIVKDMMRAHGGNMAVERRNGGGTRVSLRIPEQRRPA